MVETIKTLFKHGRYLEVLNKVNQFKLQGKHASLSEENQIELAYYHSYSLQASGQLEQGLRISTATYIKFKSFTSLGHLLLLLSVRLRTSAELGYIDEVNTLIKEGNVILRQLNINKHQTNGFGVSQFFLEKGYVYLHSLGEYEQSLEFLHLALTSFNQCNAINYIAETLLYIGRAYFALGEDKQALETFKQCLLLFQQLDHKSGIAYSLLYMSYYFYRKGEHDIKLKYSQQSLNVAEESGIPTIIAWCLCAIGYFHVLRSEFKAALDYTRRALRLVENTNIVSLISEITFTMGSAYYLMGDLDNAESYFKQTLVLREGATSEIYVGPVIFLLIRLLIDRKDLLQATNYLEKLERNFSYKPYHKFHLHVRLAKAFILKENPRIVCKARAQTILKQIITEDTFVLDWNYAVLGLLNLCELLVFEVKATGEEEVWEEAKVFINQFHAQAQLSDNFAYIGEALLLKAKIAMIEGELEEAMTLLDQAKLIAIEKQIDPLQDKTIREQELLKADLTRWNKLIQTNAPLQERFQQAQLEEYLQKVQRLMVHRI
jgi:tetratricopeptide (TPR) repeat protein